MHWRYPFSLAKRLGWYAAGRFVRPHERPIVVLGNQKAGTTAIAALLAAYGGLSSTLDIRYLSAPLLRDAHRDAAAMRAFVRRYGLDFSRAVVKEPHLSLLYEPLRRAFPGARFVMIVRDPRDNVRSILDRLALPGTMLEVAERDLHDVNPLWRMVLDGRWAGVPGGTYVERLAHRWNRIADQYLTHEDDVALVRYEDFMSDKYATIAALADACGVPQRHDIARDLDVQYQPRGNRDVPWSAFFGTNLHRLEAVCAGRMERFGYVPATVATPAAARS